MGDRCVCGEHWMPEPCPECEEAGRKEREAIRRGEKLCPVCGPELAKVRKVLWSIAVNLLTSEMLEGELDSTNFEGAYDAIVTVARKALGKEHKP